MEESCSSNGCQEAEEGIEMVLGSRFPLRHGCPVTSSS